MAVPLGEMQKKLVVAMLDADNVQAVDFLSKRINRPLKVYVASEAGIRLGLPQYTARLDTQMDAAFSTKANGSDEHIDPTAKVIDAKVKEKVNTSIATIVQ